jgi:hypothetical protein
VVLFCGFEGWVVGMDVMAQLGCCGSVVGMWLLSGDVVAQWDFGAFLGMWWLSGNVVAQWGCGGSAEMWWLSGDVVTQQAEM